MARHRSTYRAARRKQTREAKLIWREGRRETFYGGFRYGYHASMPQRLGVPIPAKVKEAA